MKNRGFTLLEIAAAMTIVALGVGAGAAGLHLHVRNVRMLFEEKVASELAAGELEGLEARAFEGVKEGTADLPVRSPAFEQLREGRVVLEVSRDRDDPALLRAVVRVSWRSGNLRRKVEVDTCYRRR